MNNRNNLNKFELSSSHAEVTSIKFTKQELVSESVSQWGNSDKHSQLNSRVCCAFKFFFLTLEELGGSRKRPSLWRGVMNMMRFVSRFRTELLLYSSSCSFFPISFSAQSTKLNVKDAVTTRLPNLELRAVSEERAKKRPPPPINLRKKDSTHSLLIVEVNWFVFWHWFAELPLWYG